MMQSTCANTATAIGCSPHVTDLYIKPDHTHARVMWHEIRALAPHDQSLVFGQARDADALEQFIASNIYGVTLELLTRKNNLYRATDPDTQAVIDQENMINDWLTSLLAHRLDYLRWTVKDQARVGSSASRNGVGEIDGGIYVGTSCISIVEAFRLISLAVHGKCSIVQWWSDLNHWVQEQTKRYAHLSTPGAL